jgi:hypothetical protein
MWARQRVGIGLSYRPARLQRLAELMPWNRFLGSIIVYKYGLRFLGGTYPSAAMDHFSGVDPILASLDRRGAIVSVSFEFLLYGIDFMQSSKPLSKFKSPLIF